MLFGAIKSEIASWCCGRQTVLILLLAKKKIRLMSRGKTSALAGSVGKMVWAWFGLAWKWQWHFYCDIMRCLICHGGCPWFWGIRHVAENHCFQFRLCFLNYKFLHWSFIMLNITVIISSKKKNNNKSNDSKITVIKTFSQSIFLQTDSALFPGFHSLQIKQHDSTLACPVYSNRARESLSPCRTWFNIIVIASAQQKKKKRVSNVCCT